MYLHLRRTLVLLLTLCLISGLPARTAAREAPPVRAMQIPSLEERLTYSADGSTATLFAPYVTRTSGWYDVNKNWYNDSHHCWAASCSNLIAWYQDICQRTGYADVSGFERNVDRIFDRYRANWDPLEGQDPLHGMNWYFTGGFSSNTAPSGYLGTEQDGGYLRSLPHCGDTWYVLDPANAPGIFGDYSARYPMLDDVTARYRPGDALYDHTSFSRTIRQQLLYGAAVIGVGASGASAASSHAITLWGCDYETESGLVTRIYVTDSDDEDRLPGHQLKAIGVKAKSPDADGVRLAGYYLSGSSAPLSEFLNSMVFYAPGAVVSAGNTAVTLAPAGPGGSIISSTADAPRQVHLFQSCYDSRGRLLAATEKQLTLLPGETAVFSMDCPPEARRYQCFALDAEGAPLCASLKTALPA